MYTVALTVKENIAHRLGMWGAQYAWLVAGAPPAPRAAPCARAQLQQAMEGLVLVDAHRGMARDQVSYAGLVSSKKANICCQVYYVKLATRIRAEDTIRELVQM
ncbi:unnamed protein product [Plutella xylostella]|uniref:(diamondback moth) hypothetical protein n=1 Tax=Plutella xylostella TaxID=51655 RepID=A0A8S4FNX1_PLUXY|nr:unnamed protein product [Plutella xylostella]